MGELSINTVYVNTYIMSSYWNFHPYYNLDSARFLYENKESK